MQSIELAAILAALIGVPGAAAFLLARASAFSYRLAVGFGVGYVIAAGSAFVLTVAAAMYAVSYLVLWSLLSAGLWLLVRRRRLPRASLPTYNWSTLGGVAVVVAIGVVYLPYAKELHPRIFRYYFDGVHIARAHGIPDATLQYGEGWPMASDKILVDSLSAALASLDSNVAAGPGALGFGAVIGAAIGLWASARELGLQRLAALVPLLMLASTQLLGVQMTQDFMVYRAENFGRAVGFCALAVGVSAIRRRSRGHAAVAGLLVAATAGTHMIAALVVMLLLAVYGGVRLVVDRRMRASTVRCSLTLAAIGTVFAGAIRVLDGGDLGLQGAESPGAYQEVSAAYDATAYLAGLGEIPIGAQQWYVAPERVLRTFVSRAIGEPIGLWVLILALGLMVVTAVLSRGRLTVLAVTGVAFFFALVAVALVFSWHYQLYIPATFGFRRMVDYLPLAAVLVGLGALEAALMRLPRARGIAATACLIATAVWLLPGMAPSQAMTSANQEQLRLLNWIRTETPCNARLVSNNRTAGKFEGLTGRMALTEGMAPYLRPSWLGHAVEVMRSAHEFFEHPSEHRDFLARNQITHVVVSGPTPKAFGDAPFLDRVYRSGGVAVYQVHGVTPAPRSPLLGRCEIEPIQL